jgi:hypothetical protein
MYRQDRLLEMIGALQASRRLPGRLHRGEQQADQDTNDGDDHQEFHKGKSGPSRRELWALHGSVV